MQFLLLLFVPVLVSGYQSSFNYGCQNGKCTYQLVVPKEVAQYIDERTLSTEVSNIASSIAKLNTTITNFSDAGASNFSALFNGNYTAVNIQAQNLSTSVNVVVQNATDLQTSSANSNTTAHLLYDSMACFQANVNSSYTCFSLPTTAAPPTQSVSTTGNPSTGDMSTVTGSTGVPVSTVPFTGSTTTGGSTEVPASSSSPPSDSSSPATSAGSSSATSSEAPITSTAAPTTSTGG